MNWNDFKQRMKETFTDTFGLQSDRSVPIKRTSNGATSYAEGPYFRPEVDVVETDRSLIIVANLPGARPEGTDISWDANHLVIHARREFPEAARPKDKEGPAAYWHREFHLPGYVDYEKAESRLHNGVLRLELPKRAEGQSRHIPVRSR